MAHARKGKGRSPERDSQAIATYFLAKHSGLFRPGEPVVLANVIKPQTSNKLVKMKGNRK